MNELQGIAYLAKAKATGGRDGKASSDDGKLKVTLAKPEALGGNGEGTNPEQLFAAGYSACFIGALELVASSEEFKLPVETFIEAEVSLGPIEHGYGIAVVLNISLGNLTQDTALSLIEKAHAVCPYSNATRDNIKVELNLI